MPQGRAPPFRDRIRVALEAAQAAGVARLKITTRDGASFDFHLKFAEADDLNDFDTIAPKTKKDLR
jgi:hypothetical protein